MVSNKYIGIKRKLKLKIINLKKEKKTTTNV
jgi:hypothetical protein